MVRWKMDRYRRAPTSWYCEVSNPYRIELKPVWVAREKATKQALLEQTGEQTRQQTGEPAPEVVLVGLAASATDAVEQVRRLAPDIALLDMAMNDAFSVARHLTRFAGASRIVAQSAMFPPIRPRAALIGRRAES